jgi:RNA-binding protein
MARQKGGEPHGILAPGTDSADDSPLKRTPPPGMGLARPMTLTGKQTRHLRALGHHLDPVVQLGKLGLTDKAMGAVDAALLTHELVKVRVGTECPEAAKALAARLGPELKAEVAQQLGRTILLYRRQPKKPKIELPKAE